MPKGCYRCKRREGEVLHYFYNYFATVSGGMQTNQPTLKIVIFSIDGIESGKGPLVELKYFSV